LISPILLANEEQIETTLQVDAVIDLKRSDPSCDGNLVGAAFNFNATLELKNP
jgi:hypothetical protein